MISANRNNNQEFTMKLKNYYLVKQVITLLQKLKINDHTYTKGLILFENLIYNKQQCYYHF